MSPAGFALRHRAALFLGTALLTAGGFYAARTLPAGIYPEATFPRIAVVARGGTFEPRDMVVAVTRPIEEAVSGTIDLRRVRSRTVRGATEFSLDFRPGTDIMAALQQVQGRISALQPSLPPGLDILVERLTPSVFPMMQFELVGGNPTALRDVAQYVIRPRLARLPDVGEVQVQGGLVREVVVELDPARLVAHRTGVVQVAERIAQANVVTAAGRVDREYRQFSVVISGLAATPDEVGDLVLASPGGVPVRVRDVGRVRYGTADRFEIASGNGQAAALVNISRQPRGNTLAVARAVGATVDSLRPLLPAGMQLEPVYDQAAFVRDAIANVRDAMLIGGGLAVLVLLAFLGRLRMTLAAAVTLPLAIAGTLAGIALAGDSLNLMSLGGLAVAIGLVIDDAVVVVENIERRLAGRQGESLGHLLASATDEILGPVASSTFTTVVVFAPLGLLEGVVGQFFRSFSLALAIAVLLSLVYAVTLIPALGAWAAAHRSESSGGFRLSLTRLEEGYAALLHRLLARPLVALGAAGLLVVAGLGCWRLVGTGFLPDMDEGGFILDYWTPTGTSLAETDRQLRSLERILAADPAVRAFTRRTGAELGFFASAPNTGDMTVLLKPRSERGDVYEVMDRLRRRLDTELPVVRVEFVQVLQDLINDLAGSPNPVEIKLFDPDTRTAEVAARRVASAVEGVPGLEDLFDGVTGDLPETVVRLDPVRVSRLGLTEATVAAEARAALFGTDAGQAREPDRLVAIRVRLPDSVRGRADIAATLPITGPLGWAPLGQLGVVQDSSETSELLRENLRPLVKVTAAVDPTKSSLGAVMTEVRRRVAGVALPPGVLLEYGGQDAEQRASFRQLLVVFGLAAGAVLLVMVGQFGELRGPLLIVLAAVLGLPGALAGLALTGVPFNVSSFMGLILLVGLVVKNGILLLDAARVQRRAGLGVAESLVAAGRLRLRPILMTTLCTIAGLAPLAFGLGSGAELQRPLAIAVIGGLSLATIVTLVLLPVALARSGALDSGVKNG